MKQWLRMVSERIPHHRTKSGMTQEVLAEKSGLPQSHISPLEAGKHSLSRVTLEKIAKALRVSVEALDLTA